jgi:hypothetical protein
MNGKRPFAERAEPTAPADSGYSRPTVIFPIDNLWWPVAIAV